jgi:DNA invertase Pin-like site-specific DNA recombinase
MRQTQPALPYRTRRVARQSHALVIRNRCKASQTRPDLREAGIALTVVNEPHLGTSAEHTLVLNIMASMAEFEHDMICGRLADTRAALKRQGRRVAGLVPYGYVFNPLTKQLQIEPVEADHVRLLFQWAAEGKPAREIANLAIRNGWRTKVRISRHDGSKRGGGSWTPRQVTATGSLLRSLCHTLLTAGSQLSQGEFEPCVGQRNRPTRRLTENAVGESRGVFS